jgi:DNA processing protein
LLDSLADFRAILRLKKDDLTAVSGIGEKTAEKILTFPFEERLEKELSFAEKRKVKIITRIDDDYPLQLKNIYSPPLVLYIQGALPASDEPAIAVVGTRRATEYGKVAAAKISGDLGKRGVIVVSGMARGIDAVAHLAAIRSGGRSIGVMGSGLDVIYPSEHRKLYQQLSEHGAVVTEFAFGTKPDKSNFPIRNRIISGLSFGTLIIEASEKSGTLITGKYTLEQGRELFAVPGNITSRQSVGTNYLIKTGAKLVQRAEDVINELPPHLLKKILPDEKVNLNKQSIANQKIELSETERKVLAVLEFDKKKHIDIVCSLLKEEPARVWQDLLSLEIKGAVQQLGGKMFIKRFEG